MKSFVKWMLVLVLIAATTPALAEDDLLKLLPPQPLLVVRATRLGPAWEALKASPLAEKLETDAPAVVAAALQESRMNLAQLQANAGVDLIEVLKGLFGGDCVLAVWGADEAAFIAKGTDAQGLKDAADQVSRLEQNWGRVLQKETLTYELVEIQKVMLADGDRYHCFIGDALVVSKNLDLVKKVVDASKKAAPVQREMAEAFESMDKAAFIRGYIDTDGLAAKSEVLLDGRLTNPFVKGFVQHIASLMAMVKYDTLAVSMRDDRLEVKGATVYDEGNLPAELKAMLPKFTVKLDALQLAPDNSILVCAHQVDKTAVWNYVMQQVSARSERLAARMKNYTDVFAAMIGLEGFQEKLLPQVGDEAALFVTLEDTPGAVPELSLVFELRGKDIPAGLKSLATTFLGMAQLNAANAGRPLDVAIEQAAYKGVDLTTMALKDPNLAGRVNPTMFVIGDCLVFSSNMPAAKAIVDRHAQGRKDLAKTFKLPEYKGTLALAGRLDAEKMLKALQMHKDFIVKQAVKKGKPQDVEERNMDALFHVLSLFEGVTFYSTHTPGRLERVLLIDAAGGEQ